MTAGNRRVRLDVDRGVATVRLAGARRNALDAALLGELVDTLSACDADPGVGAIVLTGAGHSFSVGADLSAGPGAVRDLLAGLGAYSGEDYREPAGTTTLAIARLSVPVVAAVNGDAIGGGATILLATDVRFASETSRFGFPFTRLGLSPEGASTYLLPRIVGVSRAAEWLLSGRQITASEALAAGLVSRVLQPGELLPAAQEFARDIAEHTSPSAVAATRALLANIDGIEAATAAESRSIAALADAPDGREGVAAFLERRPPRFRRGRG